MAHKITKFNRSSCRTIGDEAEAALQAVAEKYGLVLKREAGRFNANNFTAKFTFAVEAADGSGAPADFARKASVINLPEDCFGQKFTTYNGTFEVTGINLRARKYPVLGKHTSTGKVYKFTASTVRYGLKAA